MVAVNSVDEGVEEYLLDNKDLFDRVVDGKGSKADIKTILNGLLRAMTDEESLCKTFFFAFYLTLVLK